MVIAHSFDRLPLFCCRFLIGREKEGVESEVARLINESLEMDNSSTKVCCLEGEQSLINSVEFARTGLT